MQSRGDAVKQVQDAKEWHNKFFEEEAAWVSRLEAGVMADPAQVKRRKKVPGKDAEPVEDDDDDNANKLKGLPFKTPLMYARGWPETRYNYAHLLAPSVVDDLRIIQDALDVPPSWDTPQTALLAALSRWELNAEHHSEAFTQFFNMWKALPVLEGEVRALPYQSSGGTAFGVCQACHG
jgi:hypothetical protein